MEQQKENLSLVPAAPKLLLVCHGGCGANAAKAMMQELDPLEHPHLSFLVLESNRHVLKSHFAGEHRNERIVQWVEGIGQVKIIPLGDGLGAGGDPREGEEMVRKRLGEIEDFYQPFDEIFQIGGGGGGTASGAMPVIAESLAKAGKPDYAILTIPRLKEGEEKMRKAYTTRDRLLELCPTTLVYNERIVNRKLSYSKIWNEVNQACLIPALKFTRSLIQDFGDVIDIDIKDFNRGLRTGNYALPGFYDASKGLEGLEAGLLGNSYIDANIIKKALFGLFWFEGEWPVDEIDQVLDCIQSRMEHDIRDEEVGFKYGIRELGVAEGVKTVGFVAFAKEPPDEADGGEKEVGRIFGSASVPDMSNGATLLGVQEEVIVSTNNPTPIQNGNDDIDFYGTLNHEKAKEPVRISAKLAQRYEKLWGRQFSIELDEDSREVQELIYQKTGIRFDVPLRPVPATRSVWKTAGEGRMG